MNCMNKIQTQITNDRNISLNDTKSLFDLTLKTVKKSYKIPLKIPHITDAKKLHSSDVISTPINLLSYLNSFSRKLPFVLDDLE